MFSKKLITLIIQRKVLVITFQDRQEKVRFITIMQFKYTGKFPVINNMSNASETGDWKGNIAFNGETIRTDSFQTAWYPILYDIEKDKRHDAITYNIEVTCLDCKSIYVNGSKPYQLLTLYLKKKSQYLFLYLQVIMILL